MDGTTSRDDKYLLVDLLQQIKGAGAVYPDDVRVSTIIDWFPYKTERPPQRLVDLLAADSEAPLEYTDPESSRVWLTGKDEANEYINRLREVPWDELNIDGEGPIVPDLDRL